jgi:hypothetical protein
LSDSENTVGVVIFIGFWWREAMEDVMTMRLTVDLGSK